MDGGTSAEWARRDAASVWHGFTQMAAYEDNSPVIAHAAEGHEIIDVDGRRYLDAISSLWVTTLGHRVPELDRALAEQAGRVAHTTMLGNGNTVVVELAEALAARLPMDDPRILFASDGAVAVEQAVKVAFQYWENLGVGGKHRYLALGGAYHGDTVGSLSVGDGGFGTDLFEPLTFGVLRAPGYDRPDAVDVAVGLLEEHGPRARRGGGRARGAGGGGDPDDGPLGVPAAGRGRSAQRRPAGVRRGGRGLRAHRRAVRLGPVRHPAGPDGPGQGDLRRLPPPGRHRRRRPRVAGLPRGRPRRADLLPRPLLRWERPGRGRGPGAPAADRPRRRAGQRAGPRRAVRRPCWRPGWQPLAAGGGGAPAGADDRHRAGAAGGGRGRLARRSRPALGTTGERGVRGPRCADPPARRRGRGRAAPHDHCR